MELSHSSQFLLSSKSSQLQNKAFGYQFLTSLNQHTVPEDLNINLILNLLTCFVTLLTMPALKHLALTNNVL